MSLAYSNEQVLWLQNLSKNDSYNNSPAATEGKYSCCKTIEPHNNKLAELVPPRAGAEAISHAPWKEGPFGTQGEEPGKSISYYEKGPIVGLFLDFAIRHATQNEKSLDDVMQSLYWKYYIAKNRGFTDAEFEQACEEVAGTSLAQVFEYVYTTRELDYAKYLSFAGLKIDELPNPGDAQKRKFTLGHVESPDALQMSILKSWLGEK